MESRIVDGEKLQVAQYEEGEREVSSVGIDVDNSGGQSGQAVGTLRDAQPGLVLACRYGDCKRQRGAVQDQEEPRRSEAGEDRIVCSRRLFCLACAGMQRE